MYDYPSEILAIVDADTLDVLADKGTDDFKKMRIRFDRIDAPERGTPEGVAAKAWLTELLTNPDGSLKTILLFTIKDKKEKYGRYRGVFWLWGEDFSKTPSVNDRMVSAGHAVYKTY
jgi:micrococcal nuclease